MVLVLPKDLNKYSIDDRKTQVPFCDDFISLIFLLFCRFLKSCLKKLPENCEGMDLIKLDNSVEDDRPPLHTRDIVDMAIHVTLGMLYLHRHGIIHKDLATRNCV